MPDPRKKLYSALSNKYDLGSYEEFNSKMDNSESRKKLFTSVSKSFDLGSYNEFEGKVKKKEISQPISQEKQLASPIQTQDTPTSSVTEETQPPVELDGLGGPPKMKTFTGFTPEEQQTLQAKPVPKISKSAALIGKKLTLQKELSTAKVTPENQEEILRKTDELASIIKEQDLISNNRLSEIEQQFKIAKDDEAANIEADKRTNDALTNTGIWNNIKSASIDMYNAVLDQPALRAIGVDKLKADTDVLSVEKKEVLKDAAKNKIELSEEEVNQRAKQLYKNKQKDYIETDNINSFLDNLDENDKNLLKQSRRNLGEHLQDSNIKEEKVINAYEVVGNKKINEYKTIEQELLKYRNNNQPLPKDIYDTYVSLGNEIVGIGNSIQKRQSIINKNREDLGTVKQEFDLLKRRYGDIDNAVTNIGLGGTKILNGILGFTNYAAKFAGGAQGQIYSLAGQQVTDNINNYIADEENQLRKSVESIESPEGFVNYATDIIAKQIPNLIATSTGIGGLGVIGISSTGEKYTEMTREVLDGKSTYSPLQMAVAPALWGSAEVISEIPTLSILTKGGRVFDAIVKNEGNLIKKSVKEKAKEWAKDWSVDMGKEITGEEFTNFTQNFTNKYILGKKDVGLLDNTGTVLKDTFTLTNILKAAPHVAGAILKSHQDNSDLNILDENSKKIIDFSKQLENTSLNDTERAVITKQIDKATAQNSKIIANTIEKVNNMPDDVYRKIIDLNNNIADIKMEAVSINDGNLPNKAELIKSLESDYRAAHTERNALIDAKYESPLQKSFNKLENNEKIKLKDQASRILMDEAKSKGLKNFEFNDQAITDKAVELFKQTVSEVTPTEKTTAEVISPEPKQIKVTGPKIESPIELKEGEEFIDTAEDKKGNTYTYVAETSEKDGLKTTKFKFNRSDKSTEHRNDTGVDTNKVLDKYGFEIAEDEIPEGVEITKIYEIRDGLFKGERSVAATVLFKDPETGGTFKGEINLTSKAEVKPTEVPTTEVISPETSSNYANLTENKEGDFVFFHVGGKGYEKVKKSTGGTTATSKEEASALSKVGGVAMYYTKPGDTETMVNGEAKYAVTIPKEKVYDANTDANNYAKEAETRHEEENPGKAFDANTRLAYITKIAGENGYDMVVSEWMGKTRAQTTTELTPTDVQLKEGDKIAKPFEEEYVDNSEKGLKSIVPESKEAKLKAVYDEINGIRNKQNKYDELYKLSSKDLTNVPQEKTTKLIEESDLPQEVKDKYAEALAYEPEQRRTVNIVGKTVEVKNAPEGHHLNIGLLEGRTQNVMSAKDVLSKLPKDIKVISHSEIKGTEPSISVEISRPLTASEMSNFLDDTKQQAIAQLSDKKGVLYDVKRGSTEGWGDFDPSLFFTQDGNNLADVKVTEGKQKERSVLKRIKEGGNDEYINEIIDKIGVNYAQRNQQQVISDAEAFVDEVGIEKAYEAIKNGSISNGDSVTVIYASIIDRIPKIAENAIEDAKTESEKEAIKKEYNELLETVFNEFSKRQTDIGQATAILNALYIKNQEIMYSLSIQKEKYKAINAGVIDEDTLKKFEALDKRYSDANKKIKELETKLKESVDEQNFKNIIEEQNRTTSKENIGSKARNLAKDIRSGKKAVLPSWAVAEGAKGAKGQGLTFEKTFAKALETFADVHDATKDFAKAIEEGLKVLKQWYTKNNVDFNEDDIKSKFSDYVTPKVKKVTVVKGVIKIPSETISNYVANGGFDINELSEQILKDSKDEYPNLTVRQIKDQISNYGSKLNKTRSQLAEDILRLKSLGRLESQLEDLKKGISNAKNEVKKRALSDLEKKYMAQIKAVKKNLGIEEAERTTANENYVRRRIEDIKEKIKNNDFAKKEVTPIKESEELKKLKTEKNRVQEEYDKIVYTKELENRTVPEKISGFLSDMWDAQRVTRATGELSFVGAQGGFYMVNSTFSRKTFNNLVKNFRGTSLSDWTKSPIKTISKIIKSATSAETIIEMFNNMGTKNNYDDYQSLLKAHPYYDVFVKSKLRLLSEDIKTQVRDEMFIGNHFLHILKLPFTALTKFEKGKKRVTLQGYYEKLKTGKVSEKNIKTAEEIFEAANPLGIFERGNNTFMNMARVEMFMDGVQALEIQGKNPTDHLEDYKKLASAVNTITGTGNLSQQLSMALPVLNKLFFSPRFWAASLNMTPPISLYYLAKLGNYDNVTLANPKSWGSIKPTVAQKAFVKPMLKGFIAFYGMSALVVSLINSALDDDDEMTEEEKAKKRAYIEYDPRSSDFMQVVSGDAKTDFFGPYRNNMILFSRLFTGQTKKDGNIIENGAKWGSRTDFQIGTEYIAGKANPFPGMFVRYSMGKKEEVLNEETNLNENRRMLFEDRVGIDYQAKENLLPIFVGTVKDIVEEDPILGSEFYTTLALFGKQTSVYKKKPKSGEMSDADLEKLKVNNPGAYKAIKAIRNKASN